VHRGTALGLDQVDRSDLAFWERPTEGRVMLRELLRRLPDIEAAGEPVRLGSSSIDGIESPPCRYPG